MPYTITPELLASGQKYRRELLAMLVVSIQDILKHMTPRYGIQGKESVGTLVNQAQLRPYRFAKEAKDTSDIETRTLETFLGDVVEEFDPQQLWSTVFQMVIGKDEKQPDAWEIARRMAMAMAGSVGENLALNIWGAKRNESGNTTADLFDGFETIIDKEKTAGAIATSKGNLMSLGEIDEANVCDTLMGMWDGVNEALRGQRVKMFLPSPLYSLYNRGYRNDFGAAPYNREYKKTFLEGSDDKCELVPAIGTSKTKIVISPKRNMLVGMDQNGNRENVEIRRPDNPKAVQFFMLAYFGVQYESIDPRRFCVGEYTTPAGA